MRRSGVWFAWFVVVCVSAATAGPLSAGTIRTVDITKRTRFVTAETGLFRIDKIDPLRCVSALFVIWPDVLGATRYTVEVEGLGSTVGATVVAPPFSHDKFPVTGPSTGGTRTHVFEVQPGSHWHNFGTYSTGTDCDDAKATVLKSIPSRLKIVKATVIVDSVKAKLDEKRLKREKEAFYRKHCGATHEPSDFFAGAPGGAIGRLTEVSGGGRAWIQHKNGEATLAKFKMWVYPGDIILTDKNTVVAAGLITGGRVGINKNVAARLDRDGTVRAIVDPTASDPVLAEEIHEAKRIATKLSRVRDKISKRKQPLEVETAGGVTACKG